MKMLRLPRKIKKKIKKVLSFVVLEICHHDGHDLIWHWSLTDTGKKLYNKFIIWNCIQLRKDDYMFVNLYKNSHPIVVNKMFFTKWFKDRLDQFDKPHPLNEL